MGLFHWFKKKDPFERMKELSAELQRIPEDGEPLQCDSILAMKGLAEGLVLSAETFNFFQLEENIQGKEIPETAGVKEDAVLFLNEVHSLANDFSIIMGNGHRSVTLLREIMSISLQMLKD